MEFIDDRTEVVHEEEEEQNHEDPDSSEALACAADQRDFQMEEIEAGHQARLQSAVPYRIPESLLTQQTPKRERQTAKIDAVDSRPATPPRKRRRTEKSSIQQYFDVAAEESDEEEGNGNNNDGGEEDEDNEDETLSDKEFLDDEPIHDAPALYRNLPNADDDAERESAETTAARYQQASAGYSRDIEAERRGQASMSQAFASPNAGQSSAGEHASMSSWMQDTMSTLIDLPPAPLPRSFSATQRATNRRVKTKETVVPGTWIRIPTGKYRNSVALVLPSREGECLVCADDKRTTVSLPKDCEPVRPTPTELANFNHADSSWLTQVHFIGMCSALTEGDRVVVVDGPDMCVTGFITMIRDVPTFNNTRVRYAKVQRDYDGVAVLKKEDPGVFVQLTHLQRHVLDNPIPIGPFDRVRVVSGTQYLGYSGRVVALDDPFFEVDVSKPPQQMENIRISISLRYLTRDFHSGDMVQSQAIGSTILCPDEIEDKIPTAMFKVHSADVTFALFSDSSVKQGFTTQSEVPAIPNNMTPTTEYNELTTLHDLLADLEAQDRMKIDQKMSMMKTGRRFEGLHVIIAHKHSLKGMRCVVKGDHDSPKRVARLEKGSTRKAWRGDMGDIHGIIATVSKMDSNHTFEIDVKYLVHAYTRLPLNKAIVLPPKALAPPLPPPTSARSDQDTRPGVARFQYFVGERSIGATADTTSDTPHAITGEDNGEWICIPSLTHKRVDVVVRGIEGLADHRATNFKNSPTLRKLEGKKGYLLIEEPPSVDMVDMKKLKVFAVGRNLTAHNVPAKCIKPFRGLDEMPLTKFRTRVVIIGPDITGDGTFKGLYGETQPPDHNAGSESVGVRFQAAVESQIKVFPLLSLCQAENVEIHASIGIWPASLFE
ncbi:hypothetical protein C8R44DRAFT_888677 [Mycena epipterygia]|nr:hypothetical protein C8R44DRAFT_888677 [Mycena epipterygia]